MPKLTSLANLVKLDLQEASFDDFHKFLREN